MFNPEQQGTAWLASFERLLAQRVHLPLKTHSVTYSKNHAIFKDHIESFLTLKIVHSEKEASKLDADRYDLYF